MDYSELKVPNHVAIIVDGNGRWAKEKGMTRSQGHDAGFENLKDIATYIFEKGTKVFGSLISTPAISNAWFSKTSETSLIKFSSSESLSFATIG